MSEEILDLLLTTNVEGLYLIVAMGLLRPLGLLFGFIAFSWGLGASTTLRASIAFALGLPLMLSQIEASATLVASASRFELALLAPKEFAIGYGLGLLASLPFFALQYAGAVTDAYRGESDSGIQDPTGGTLQTIGVLYLAIGLFTFASLGGLWQLIASLYDSFTFWPVDSFWPTLTPSAGAAALQMLDHTLAQAVTIALPLLICLMTVEFVIVVSAKLGKKFGTYDLVFLSKNLIAILSLPLVAYLIGRWTNANVAEPSAATNLLERLIQ